MMDLNAKLKHYRISASEFEMIKKLLGREPKGLEWALFSALWSEHCSYKSSRVHFKKFYSKNERVLQSEGENAGIVDLGLGEKICFKMESHNHPSFIEPFQGAATGVGGILRDIFTMGARPIALNDYLCFGEAKAPRMNKLVKGVVAGISHYGNCVGVPNIGGNTEFHASYNNNILVNAMAIGYLGPNDKIALSKAKGIGNHIVYVGAKTGKDGVHGASMASESFDENSEAKKPNVQIGDPFYEKLLIEACLDVIQKDLVVSIQDMGAAGLTSSSFEMAAKGNLGMKIHLDKVPLRDSSVEPEEILLSESQERMLLICEPQKYQELEAVFKHWGLDAAIVGEVLAERKVELLWKNEMLLSIDPHLLTENAPLYQRPFETWNYPKKIKQGEKTLPVVSDLATAVKQFFANEVSADKSWIYQQYDQRVGARTAWDASHSLGCLQLPSSKRGLFVTTGCRPHLMRMDAKIGAMDAVLFPALQISLYGGVPMAVTDCLNFGNPEKPDIMSEFIASIEGLSEACEAFDAPVISGNVSFYNETLGQNITSTPAIGMVGLRPTVDKLLPDYFTEAGDAVYLVSLPMIYATGLLQEINKGPMAFAGELDAFELSRFSIALKRLAQLDYVKGARVVGSGGLLPSLVKMSKRDIGLHVEMPKLPPHFFFQERMYEFVFVLKNSERTSFENQVSNLRSEFKKIQYMELGFTKAAEIHLNGWQVRLSDLQLQRRQKWQEILLGVES